MSDYIEIPVDKAYRLINHGPLILVSTRSKDERYNIAPIGWNCPVEVSPARILIAIDPGHQTYRNIEDTGEFIACVPNSSQADIVRNTGSVSGRDADKFKEFNIDFTEGHMIKAAVPKGCVGHIECKVIEKFEIVGTALVIGEAVCAYADKRGFTDRVLPESSEGQTLHHLGGGVFGILTRVI
jgi:flavin reductase (DIM6/NTAB) family NADH-FMN oxidoreductase RutF